MDGLSGGCHAKTFWSNCKSLLGLANTQGKSTSLQQRCLPGIIICQYFCSTEGVQPVQLDRMWRSRCATASPNISPSSGRLSEHACLVSLVQSVQNCAHARAVHLDILKDLRRHAGGPVQHADALARQELLRQALAEHRQERHRLSHHSLEVLAVCRLTVATEGCSGCQHSMILGLRLQRNEWIMGVTGFHVHQGGCRFSGSGEAEIRQHASVHPLHGQKSHEPS